jgi:HK97 family phage major capsid protein
MTVKEYTEKKLAELKKKESMDVVLKTKSEQSDADKALTSKFYKALASRKMADLEEVNSLIIKDYKAKAQSVGTIGSGTSGGLLVPTTVADSIISKMKYISPIRQIATVISDMPAQLQLPSENTMALAYWIAEGAPITESGEVLDPNLLTPFKAAGLDSFTSEVIADAATNPSIQNYVESRFAIALALLENAAFVNGDGSGKPYGFRSSAITPNSLGVVGDNVVYSDVVALKYSLLTAYRKTAVFVAGSNAVMALENIKDNYGRPIWRDGLTEDQPATLLGRPIYLVDEIPTNLGTSGTATELWFGTFSNYFIGDRGALRIDYGTNGTDFANDKISLRVVKRVAGRPVIGEGFSKLTDVQ